MGGVLRCFRLDELLTPVEYENNILRDSLRVNDFLTDGMKDVMCRPRTQEANVVS